jgi:hypothetical protein
MSALLLLQPEMLHQLAPHEHGDDSVVWPSPFDVPESITVEAGACVDVSFTYPDEERAYGEESYKVADFDALVKRGRYSGKIISIRFPSQAASVGFFQALGRELMRRADSRGRKNQQLNQKLIGSVVEAMAERLVPR